MFERLRHRPKSLGTFLTKKCLLPSTGSLYQAFIKAMPAARLMPYALTAEPELYAKSLCRRERDVSYGGAKKKSGEGPS